MFGYYVRFLCSVLMFGLYVQLLCSVWRPRQTIIPLPVRKVRGHYWNPHNGFVASSRSAFTPI